jgi:2-polyprenyl-3-methyl-5-hydroxy-6-metoxy-1,4-benzoquinol methylase
MNIECPLCGSDRSALVEQYGTIGAAKYECMVVCCSTCGHYFTKTAQDLDLEQLYSEGQYEVIDTRGSLFEKIVAFDDLFIVRQLSKFPVPQKTLLDFGCGKGQFMYRALEYGWRVLGIETGKKRAEFGIDVYGLNIITSEYEGEVIQGGPFSAITLFHVLEHLGKPKPLLKELIDSNLVRGGYLVIEVPLFESLQSKIAGKWWIHLDPSPKRLF